MCRKSTISGLTPSVQPPGQGRFVNRDPIEEAGGLNLYAFCGNDAVDRYDLLGNVDNPSAQSASIVAANLQADQGGTQPDDQNGAKKKDPIKKDSDKDTTNDITKKETVRLKSGMVVTRSTLSNGQDEVSFVGGKKEERKKLQNILQDRWHKAVVDTLGESSNAGPGSITDQSGSDPTGTRAADRSTEQTVAPNSVNVGTKYGQDPGTGTCTAQAIYNALDARGIHNVSLTQIQDRLKAATPDGNNPDTPGGIQYQYAANTMVKVLASYGIKTSAIDLAGKTSAAISSIVKSTPLFIAVYTFNESDIAGSSKTFAHAVAANYYSGRVYVYNDAGDYQPPGVQYNGEYGYAIYNSPALFIGNRSNWQIIPIK